MTRKTGRAPVAEVKRAGNAGGAETKMPRTKRHGRAAKPNGAPNERHPSEFTSKAPPEKVTPKSPRKNPSTERAPVVGMGDHTPAFMLRPARTDGESRDS